MMGVFQNYLVTRLHPRAPHRLEGGAAARQQTRLGPRRGTSSFPEQRLVIEPNTNLRSSPILAVLTDILSKGYR